MYSHLGRGKKKQLSLSKLDSCQTPPDHDKLGGKDSPDPLQDCNRSRSSFPNSHSARLNYLHQRYAVSEQVRF